MISVTVRYSPRPAIGRPMSFQQPIYLHVSDYMRYVKFVLIVIRIKLLFVNILFLTNIMSAQIANIGCSRLNFLREHV